MAADTSRRWRLVLTAFIVCGLIALAQARPLVAVAQARPFVPVAQARPLADSADMGDTATTLRSKPAPLPVATAPAPLSKASGSWVGAGFAFGVLNLPKLGAGVELIAEARPRRFWPIDFTLVYWFDNASELNRTQLDLQADPVIAVPFPETGSRIVARAFQASAALCPYETELSSGSLLLCAGAQGGLIHVSSEGFVDQAAQTRALFAFDAYVRWHFRLGGGVGISYSAGAFVPLLRDRFGYQDRNGDFHQQFRVGIVGARLDIAVTYGF